MIFEYINPLHPFATLSENFHELSEIWKSILDKTSIEMIFIKIYIEMFYTKRSNIKRIVSSSDYYGSRIVQFDCCKIQVVFVVIHTVSEKNIFL